MITVSFDPIVLEKLQASFPRPKNSATKALNRYKQLLQELLFKALQRGRSNYETLFDLYSLPVADLTHRGPHIGSRKIRLHKWLKDNHLDLVEVVEKGNNLTGLVSKVKLTEYVHLSEEVNEIAQVVQGKTTPAALSSVLCSDAAKNQEIFTALYPDYFAYLSSAQRNKVFDVVPVNTESLETYIAWLNTKSTMLTPGRVRLYTQQAMLILSVAKHTGGYFPQRRKVSPFGRTYYEGLSVQNVNKELRRAMLGNCWIYDIRSSVVTWKMTFAQEFTDLFYPLKECRKLFWASTFYLESRAEFMRDVRWDTFGKSSQLSVEFEESLIKSAVTAISFGARANVTGWYVKDGQWTNTALSEIFKNSQERAAFLNSATIQDFIKEQALLDGYLADELKKQLPDVYFGPLITANLRPSKSKAVAYCYQQSETTLMDLARDVLAAQGITPIANIHDAFVVRHKLSIDLRSEVVWALKDKTQNDFWYIKSEKLEAYQFSST